MTMRRSCLLHLAAGFACVLVLTTATGRTDAAARVSHSGDQ
jgi:hypothetical protein